MLTEKQLGMLAGAYLERVTGIISRDVPQLKAKDRIKKIATLLAEICARDRRARKLTR